MSTLEREMSKQLAITDTLVFYKEKVETLPTLFNKEWVKMKVLQTIITVIGEQKTGSKVGHCLIIFSSVCLSEGGGERLSGLL